MNNCAWSVKVARWFDEQDADEEALHAHLDHCPACAAYVAALKRQREGVAAVAAREGIGDQQFPAFMNGIREGVQQPARPYARLWAWTSLAAAALIVAVSVFSVTSGDPAPVEGTVVESWSTDLEDADVTYHPSKNGTTTVWVNVPREDLW